ncbi:MAG: putative Ig domain-containing protein [Raineya sp.]|jgi:uncharacterized delta-60 repeat protein|nr:putative Ig domain-containing protein [Raineya sp.]
MYVKLLFPFFLFSCFLFQIPDVFAQAGQNDASFNVADNKYHFKAANTALLKQSDGKTLVANDWGNIMRLNSDGTLDETFLSGLGASGQINDALMQPDGKIILVGDFILYNELNEYSIIRLNANGSVDNTFLGDFINIDYAYLYTVALQSDGKILVAGSFTTCGGVTKNSMVRLNTDGSLDNTFDVGTGVFGASIGNQDIYDIVIQPDGKILVVGGFTKFNGFDRKGMVRLNADGSVDASFIVGSGFSGYIGYFFARVYALALQPDGKILVAGAYYGYNGTNRPCLVRLNTDGSIDNTFDTGIGFNDIVHSVVLQSDGKILAGGIFNTVNGIAKHGLVRLNADGSIDIGFDVGTGITGGGFTFVYGVHGSVFEILLESDGKILLGGNFGFYNGVGVSKVMRLNTDGSLDMSFERGTGFNGSVIAITKQPDGKILVGGFVSSFNQTKIGRIIRLHPDGSVDNSFQTPILELDYDYGVYEIELQPDGKILVVGNLYESVSDTYKYVIRLNTDGSLDNTFQIQGAGLTGTVTSCKYLPNGKILIGGVFYSYNGIPTGGFIRLNTDGSLDTSFNGGATGISLLGLGEVSEIVLQPNGKIIAGGIFSEYNGVAKNNLIRANENGSIDTTFKSSGCNDWVSGIALQPNGKIIVGGAFTTCNGISRNRIARLNSDGSLDTSFKVGTGFKGGKYTAVLKLQLQDDGKVIVVGDFTSYNGIPIKNICRLNRDGSLDNTFQAGSSVDERIYTAIIDSNDKILIGGFFGKYQGSFRNGIARLQNCVGRISPKTLNPIIQETPYTQTFTQTGIPGNVTWQIISGSLPQGLSLNSSTGVISGTPTSVLTTTITLQVSNGICFSTEEFELKVSPCSVQILPDSLIVGTVGSNYSQTFTQIGISGNVTWQVASGNLPQGLSLNTNTGEITGVPIISDSTEFEIAVLGGVCLDKKKYQIKVLNAVSGCDINVYPNPTSQNLKIAFNNSYQGNYQIKLFDMLGREVLITNFVVKREKEWAILDIEDLIAEGVYILVVKGEFCEKLLKVIRVNE